MSRHVLKFAAVAAVLLLAGSLFAAEVIDRVVATVNAVPLLQSDLEDSLRMEAFLQQRKLETFTATEREAVFTRMIDQELLRQQMQSELEIAESEIDAQIAVIRKQCKVADDTAWQNLLISYGLDERLLRERLGAQLTTMRFVDQRLRPTVRIDRDAVEAYYRKVLVPKLEKQGAKVDPLSALAPRIQELLAQQRIDELLSAWLANLRNQSTIHVANDLHRTTRAGAVAPVASSAGGR